MTTSYERTGKGMQENAYKNYRSKKADFFGFALGLGDHVLVGGCSSVQFQVFTYCV